MNFTVYVVPIGWLPFYLLPAPLDLQTKHRTSCQALGNLCAVLMYNDERKVNPCKAFKDYRRIPTSSDADRSPLPWIYYGDGDASIVLNRKKITSVYSIKPGRLVRLMCYIILLLSSVVVYAGFFNGMGMGEGLENE